MSMKKGSLASKEEEENERENKGEDKQEGRMEGITKTAGNGKRERK